MNRKIHGIRIEDDEDIPLHNDGFNSLQDRDKHRIKVKREMIKKEKKFTQKAVHALELERENVDKLEAFAKGNMEVHQEVVVGLIQDIKYLIEILLKHPEVLTVEDVDYIDALDQKITQAVGDKHD